MTLTSSQCGPLSSILHSGFQKADDGDLSELLKLGLSVRVIRKVQNLPSRKHSRACNLLSAHLGDVLHRELGSEQQQQRLEAIVTQVEKDPVDEVKKDKLILKKAPRDMMYRLCAMSYRDFATLRAALNVSDTGRPRKVSPKQAPAIWDSWRRHEGLPYSDRFLQVAQDTHLDLRTIWPVLKSALGVQTTRRRRSANHGPRQGAATAPTPDIEQRT